MTQTGHSAKVAGLSKAANLAIPSMVLAGRLESSMADDINKLFSAYGVNSTAPGDIAAGANATAQLGGMGAVLLGMAGKSPAWLGKLFGKDWTKTWLHNKATKTGDFGAKVFNKMYGDYGQAAAKARDLTAGRNLALRTGGQIAGAAKAYGGSILGKALGPLSGASLGYEAANSDWAREHLGGWAKPALTTLGAGVAATPAGRIAAPVAQAAAAGAKRGIWRHYAGSKGISANDIAATDGSGARGWDFLNGPSGSFKLDASGVDSTLLGMWGEAQRAAKKGDMSLMTKLKGGLTPEGRKAMEKAIGLNAKTLGQKDWNQAPLARAMYQAGVIGDGSGNIPKSWRYGGM